MFKIKFSKFLISIIIVIYCGPSAFALDFISGREFNAQAGKGYNVKTEDTIAGYPIFAADGDWKIYFSFMGEATGGMDRVQQPIIYMYRNEFGKWAMDQEVTVAMAGLSTTGGWRGDPCSGDFIVKIYVNRGKFDRCATAKFVDKKLSGVPTEAVEIKFTETNSSGRLYISTFNIYYGNLGLTRSELSDRNSDVNKKIKDWMSAFMEGVIKASSFEKPADAFKNVPTFSSAVLNGTKSPSATVNQKTENAAALGGKTILDRLLQLKNIFDNKLITEDDYNRKRSEILNGL